MNDDNVQRVHTNINGMVGGHDKGGEWALRACSLVHDPCKTHSPYVNFYCHTLGSMASVGVIGALVPLKVHLRHLG